MLSEITFQNLIMSVQT